MTTVDLATWLIIGCIVQVSILFTTWYFIDVESRCKMNRELDELDELYSSKHPLPTPTEGQVYLFDD
jgi:hypothetical protein